MNEEEQKDTTSSGAVSGAEASGDQTNDQTNHGQATSRSSEPSNDAERNKLFAVVGYILPILFFVPLVRDESKESPFACFHANQQLILLIFFFVIYALMQVVHSMFMFGMFFFSLLPLLQLVGLVFAVIGIINAAGGKKKELPLIGGFNLL